MPGRLGKSASSLFLCLFQEGLYLPRNEALLIDAPSIHLSPIPQHVKTDRGSLWTDIYPFETLPNIIWSTILNRTGTPLTDTQTCEKAFGAPLVPIPFVGKHPLIYLYLSLSLYIYIYIYIHIGRERDICM